MNRSLQYVNLLGVMLLTGLCVFQWKTDQSLHFELRRLDRTRVEQSEKIVEQQQEMEGLSRDIGIIKDQFTTIHSNFLNARKELAATELENARLKGEGEQLRSNNVAWKNAVALRDERLAETARQLLSVTEKANDSIRKFNDLATNYNAVVDQLNAFRKQQTNISVTSER